MKKKSILLALLVLFTSSIWASDPNGAWGASDGTKINVWSNMQQVVVTATFTNGQSYRYNGRWTRFSDYFSFQGPDGVYNASFKGANQIIVRTPKGGQIVWNRGQAPVRQQAVNNRINYNGLWKSSTGTSIQFHAQGNQVTVTSITSSGQRFKGSGRWIQPGIKFDYSFSGYPGIAVGTIVNRNQISVNYRGKVSIWSRQ